MLGLSIASLAIGLTLLLLGLRGRRTDDHPLCRKCRFDLIGLIPGGRAFSPTFSPSSPSSAELSSTQPRCPECGADLSSPRSTRTGNRRRVRPAITLGLLFTIAALVLGGAFGWSKAKGFNWNTIKPEWWLASEAHNATIATADAALDELASRLSNKKLSATRADSLAAEALAIQADPNSAWSQGWADFLELASSKNLLSDSQQAAYARAVPSITMSGRPNAVQGAKWAMELHARGARVSRNTRLNLHTLLLSASIDGVPQTKLPIGQSFMGISGGGSSSIRSPMSLGDVAVGKHTITALWSFAIQEGYDGKTPPLTSWEEEFSTPIEILPPGTATVTFIHDDAARPAVEKSITTRQNSASGTAGAPLNVMGDIYFNSPPLPLAFDVFWRYPDAAAPGGFREEPMGTITCTGGGGSFGNNYMGTLPAGFNADHVDVILRPSLSAAAETETMTQIWDGELTLANVPVQLNIRPAAPADVPPNPAEPRP